MTILRTDLGNLRERARELRFEQAVGITAHDVQGAIEQLSSRPAAVVPTPVAVGASPYTVLVTDTVLYVDTSGGAITILLEPAANRAGVPLTIKDISGNASTNNITITPNGAETIDSLATLPINADFGGYRLNPRTSSYTLAP